MIVNLTPHPINIINRRGDVTLTIPPSGEVARLGTTESGSAVVDQGVEIMDVGYGEVDVLPPMVRGTWLVVSLATALAVRRRTDLVVPYVEVRDDNGRILGCRALARPAP